jgi:hypothetical protein
MADDQSETNKDRGTQVMLPRETHATLRQLAEADLRGVAAEMVFLIEQEAGRRQANTPAQAD